MSALSSSSLSHSSLPLSRRTPAPLTLAAVLRRLAQWHVERRTRAALGRLDNHLLQDIGLDPRLVETPLPRLFPGF